MLREITPNGSLVLVAFVGYNKYIDLQIFNNQNLVYISEGWLVMRFVATVVISQDENWYVAKCLENNIASHGKTVDESLSNLKEALELYFEDNKDIPEAKQQFITTMEIVV